MTIPDFKREAAALYDDLVRVRRDLHRHPELGFQEVRTAGIVAETLTGLGLEVQTGVGQTGVVALLEGARPGPNVLLRFDMDALPIQEESSNAYISTRPGVMHACGHDGHVSMGLALADLFVRRQDQMAGSLKFLFQPAEEGLGGALAVMAGGVLENPRPDVALAMHLWSPVHVGQARVVDGPAMASSSVFTLTVEGRGGHGAAPHLATDPIVAAAQIVTALQSIVSRNTNPNDSVVVSIGEFSAGTTFNVIPERAILKGTVRSYDTATHRMVYRRILEMATSVATAFGCRATMETVAIVAAVHNAPEPTAVVRAAAERVLGAENILEHRTMAAEDMGFILQEIPGCYFFVGCSNGDLATQYPHHHPRFDFDERAMVDGVAIMAEAAGRYVLA
ncbi:Peptidase M20 family hydrolase [Candidatus Promineifilum breve]|uniref:Peptidase M20 family hydrolase n=1 Tax=Candidatus Promineifilum breve TaxID=1806508 RepID=A0A160T4I6_9CHLR|nr:amidohydrolase [Candidatus Promineifilum breve]CUS04702.2 Peptidase M20 family hydrolase [Candidatus Promineifilum breve]